MSDNIARGLADLMREAQESLTADAAQAPAEVSAAARSRRRRSGGVLGAVAVVAGVAVVTAGIGVANGNTPEATPAFSASPSAVPSEDLSVPLTSTTIPINGGPQYQPGLPELDCGSSAPQPTGTVDHFGVAIAEAPPLTLPKDALSNGNSTRVDTWTTYDAQETVPVEQEPVTLLLLHEGKIAGRFMPLESLGPYWTYSDFKTYQSEAWLFPVGQFCPEVSTPTSQENYDRVLDPGEYQVMPMAHVWATEESAALKYLYKQSIRVEEYPASFRPSGFRPGSWDCEQSIERGAVPRACLGDVTGNAIVDEEAGTVTLPYDPDQLPKTFDAKVIGEPVTLIVPEEIERPEVVYTNYAPKPLDVSNPIECGTTFDYTTPESSIQVSGQVPTPLGLDNGAFNAFNVGILPRGQGTGEFDLEYGAKVWLVADRNQSYNYFAEQPGNQRIVGVASVSIAGGNTVHYDRYAGPTTVNLVLTDVRLCDDFDQARGFQGAIIDGNVAVTPTGERHAGYEHQLLYVRPYFGL